MKVAEDEIFLSKVDSMSVDNGIHQQVYQNRVGQDLLKGEVTQEVAELRYRDYRVYKESKNYQYIGDGEVIKQNKSYSNVFHQSNQMVCKGTFEDIDSQDSFTLKIEYNGIPRFRLERLVQSITCYQHQAPVEIVLNINNSVAYNDPQRRSFLNELEKIYQLEQEGLKVRNEIYDNIKHISFVTYKAVDEDDFIKYDFYSLHGIETFNDEGQYKIRFIVDMFNREDLTDKFYSSSMDEKYKNKEEKQRELRQEITKQERKKSCYLCGVEINVYDGDITEATFGVPLCKNCLEKRIINEKLE